MTGASSVSVTVAPSNDEVPVVVMAAAARRIVFDTNVLLSMYVFADSRFACFRDKVEAGHWIALTSEACLAEFRRVLGYPMFDLDSEAQAKAFAMYAASAQHAVPLSGLKVALPACSDRDDQKFLELARDGRADWLLGTGTAADTINIGTGATNADAITLGNTGVASTVAINSGVTTTDAVTMRPTASRLRSFR